MPKYSILVVDDEKSFREFLEILFLDEGFSVFTAKSISTAVEILKNEKVDLVLFDLMLGNEDGLQIPRLASEIGINIPFILMTAYANTETALESIRLGVVDYVTKPFDTEKLVDTIKNILHESAHDEVSECCEELKEIVGVSDCITKVKRSIIDVAGTDSTVLISGESGTGKEVVARAIHKLSNRNKYEFVAINCGAIPSDLLEAELFGYKKGAFTGAVSEKKGLFEIANRGTIFLDEIGDMPLFLQVKLLRVLQERKILPIGGTNYIDIDVRVIAASNKDLLEEIEKNNFRKDLFYRLNVVNIFIPPLRDRKVDIPYLAKHFLEKYSRLLNKEIGDISFAVMEMLKRYDYPGNVRELENIIERAVVVEKSNKLLPTSISEHIFEDKYDITEGSEITLPVNLESLVEKLEEKYIKKALEVAENNQSKAAKLLGLTLRTFRYKMSKYDVK
ncbi:sigma-54-dependent Fis family transcriptional regulator [Deferribacteraceae bacterium V6Fe1]|nr:sigma-54-dependent Fis family transcriptional regulator [Deferribacteraceae bacterium V6Fe1]